MTIPRLDYLSSALNLNIVILWHGSKKKFTVAGNHSLQTKMFTVSHKNQSVLCQLLLLSLS